MRFAIFYNHLNLSWNLLHESDLGINLKLSNCFHLWLYYFWFNHCCQNMVKHGHVQVWIWPCLTIIDHVSYNIFDHVCSWSFMVETATQFWPWKETTNMFDHVLTMGPITISHPKHGNMVISLSKHGQTWSLSGTHFIHVWPCLNMYDEKTLTISKHGHSWSKQYHQTWFDNEKTWFIDHGRPCFDDGSNNNFTSKHGQPCLFHCQNMVKHGHWPWLNMFTTCLTMFWTWCFRKGRPKMAIQERSCC